MKNIFDKLSKELTLQQKWKEGIWLQTMVACKRINFLQLQYLEIYTRLMEEIYPGQWDMYINVNKQYQKLRISFQAIINFQNLTISNTRKQSIPIKSIFVKLPYHTNYSGYRHWMDNIQGMRNIVSYNEYSNNYAHSHLTSVNYSTHKLIFEQFCTGSGEINFLFSKLNQQFSEGMLKTLLFHLKGYLEWESLEGVPYITINELFLKSKNEGITYLDYSTIKNEGDNIISKQITRRTKLDWILKDNSYQIKDNEKLEQYCRQYTTITSKLTINAKWTNLYYYKDKQDNYYPLNASIEDVKIDTTVWFPFQGTKQVMQVEGVLENQTDENYYIHPKIKEYVKRQLETTINRKYIKDSAIRQLQD